MTQFARINGHRGQSATHPENTLPALREAVRLGANGVEFDVQLTSDGAVVLMHDRSPMRTTNVRDVFRSKVGLSVERFTLNELAALDAGRWKAPQFAAVPVPTLRDVVHALSDTRIRLVIELKAGQADPRRFVRTVLEDIGNRPNVTLMSFDPLIAQAALPLHDRVGLVTNRAPAAADLQLFDEFHVNAKRIDRRVVESVHESGSTLTAWTVDDRKTIDRLQSLGVDAITTNNVTAARPALV